MSHLALKHLIGAALVDRDVCNGLMNGQRSQLLTDFDLTDEERQVVESFEVTSARDLASSVHNWLVQQDSPLSPHLECSATVRIL
jgi:hypothetical protein